MWEKNFAHNFSLTFGEVSFNLILESVFCLLSFHKTAVPVWITFGFIRSTMKFLVFDMPKQNQQQKHFAY